MVGWESQALVLPHPPCRRCLHCHTWSGPFLSPVGMLMVTVLSLTLLQTEPPSLRAQYSTCQIPSGTLTSVSSLYVSCVSCSCLCPCPHLAASGLCLLSSLLLLSPRYACFQVCPARLAWNLLGTSFLLKAVWKHRLSF